VVGAAAAVAVLLVGFFELQTSLPLLDEYARRWSIQQLVAGHGFQSLGSSPQIVQLLLSAPLALLKTDPPVWRLTSLPFIAMQGVFCVLIARDLGRRPAVGAYRRRGRDLQPFEPDRGHRADD
jgi:hypothetical protein